MNNIKKNNNHEKKISKFSILLNKYYKFIIGFLSLIILIPAVLMLIRPEYSKTKNLSAQQMPLKEKRLTELDEYHQDLNDLVKNLDYLQQLQEDEFEKLEKILPGEAGIASLFVQMEAIFADKNFEILNISFVKTPVLNIDNQKEAGQKIGRVEISLNASGGGYFDFKELLDYIEKHLRIMDVSAVNFGDIYSDGDDNQKASYTLTISSYYLQ